jgi:hypothetical protein
MGGSSGEGMVDETWAKKWAARADCRHSRAMLPNPSFKRWTKLMGRHRKNLKTLVAFITGHIDLRRHQDIVKQLGKADTRCRSFLGDNKTPVYPMAGPATELTWRQYEDCQDAYDPNTQLQLYEDLLSIYKDGTTKTHRRRKSEDIHLILYTYIVHTHNPCIYPKSIHLARY